MRARETEINLSHPLIKFYLEIRLLCQQHKKIFFALCRKIKSNFLIGFLLLALALSHSLIYHLWICIIIILLFDVNVENGNLISACSLFKCVSECDDDDYLCAFDANVFFSSLTFSVILAYTHTHYNLLIYFFPFLSHLQVNFLAYHLWIKRREEDQQQPRRRKRREGKATESQGHIATTKQTLLCVP